MPNNAPVAQPVSSNSDEDASILISADFSDADPGDAHTFSVDTTGTIGSVTNNNDGTFSYDPNGQFEHLAAGETATDTFTYTVDDGNGGTSTETVTVTVTGQNDAPVAIAVAASTDEDGPAITVTADFSDIDATDAHTYSVDTTGTIGSVTNNNDGTFSYDPNGQFEYLAAGETATDTFTYTVDDGNGGTSTETVTVTITGQNDAPVAIAVAASASEDGPAITVTTNFSDIDATDTHTFSVDATGTIGSVTNNGDGTFSYDPNGQFEHLAAGETATDTFTYTVDDGNGGTSTETVTMTITGQNDAPVAVAIAASAEEDGPAITVTADFSDIDASDIHTFSVDTTGTIGSVSNNNDGTFSYDPNGQFEHLAAGETTTDTFTYTVDDGNGGTSTETVTVTITGQNDAPVAIVVAASASEDGPAITINSDFSDVDASDTHTFSVDTTGTIGSVTNNNDGTFFYDPNGQFEHLAAGETTTDTFTYTVDDGNGGTSTETVTVTITGQNDAPVAVAVAASADEDGPAIPINSDFSDVDASDTHSFSVDTTGTIGSVTNNNDGTFAYDPNGQFEHLAAGETTTDTFTYTVDDGNGGTSTETVTVTITGQNDAPVAVAVAASADEDGPAITVTADFSDIDASDTHTFSVDTTGTVGSVTNNNDGTFSYDANGQFEHLAAGETATDTFTYTVTDPSGVSSTETVTVTVTGQNDAPVVTALTGATQEDGPSITVTADFTDIDTTDTHTFSVDTTGTLGDVTDNGDGTFAYDPNGAFDFLAVGETATDVFTYTVHDGNGGATTETVTITLTGQNDAPVAAAVAATAPEDGPVVTINADVSDPDASDTHTFSIDTTGTIGSVTNNNDGTFSYDPNGQFEHLAAGETATDTFTYTVTDPSGVSSTETVTVTVTGQNDAPLVSALTGATQEDGPSVTVSADFTDIDATDTHMFSVDTTGTLGAVTDNGDGTFAYDPNGAFDYLAVGETATDVFTYTVHDGNGGATTETVTITLTGQNDAPVAEAVAATAEEDGPAIVIEADFVDVDLSDTHTFSIDTTGTIGTVTNNGDGTFTYHPNAQFEVLNPGETATDTFTYTVDDGHGGVSTETVTVTIEGQVEPTKLTASDGASGDNYGYWTAVNDLGAVVVGARGNDDDGTASGSVYVYTPNSNGAYTETKLTASDAAANDAYGYSVAINNAGTVAVGSFFDDDRGTESGSVYVYSPDGNGGYTELKLHASDGSTDDRFGIGLSINESGVIAVGATDTGAAGAPRGAAYVYTPDGNGGYSEVKLVASDSEPGNFFGYPVEVTETGSVLVGASFYNAQSDKIGALYVYQPDGNGGYEELKITSPSTIAQDGFGFSGTMNSAGTVVATAHLADDGGDNTGALFVYDLHDSGGYTERQLVPSDLEAGDILGYRVAINESGVIVVGAHGDDDIAPASGAAYVYIPDGNGNYSEIKLTPPDATASIYFGWSVSINEDGVVSIGARIGDGEEANSGAVYTYVPDNTGNYVGYDGTVYTGSPFVLAAPPAANSVDAGTVESGTVVVAADFTDPDTAGGHTFTIDTGSTAGSVTNNGDGTFSYDANGQFEHLSAGETATDTFKYTVSDGNGGASTEWVTITITGENDAPAAAALSVSADEDGSGTLVTASFTDVDLNDSHTFTVDTSATVGAVTNNGDGTFSYNPNGQFEYLSAGETATDTFTYTVDDGNGGTSTETVTVTVTGANDAPVAVAVAITAGEDGPPALVTALFSDTDTNDTHSFTVNTAGTTGAVTNNGDGTFSYDANGQFEHLAAGETATDTFTYTVDDGNGGTSTETVTVTVTGANDAPNAEAVAADISWDSTITVAADFFDPDVSDTHTFSVDTTGTLGLITNNGDGTFSYDPNGQFDNLPDGSVATDTFTYTVDDGHGGVATETVTITVRGPLTAAKLEASDGGNNDRFGETSAINESGMVLVGAHGDDDAGNAAGAAYLYTPDGNGGFTELKLSASNASATAGYGYSVALNNAGTAVVGAYNKLTTGVVYIYQPDGNGSHAETKLTASDAETSDRFGWSVDINEAGTIAVGAWGDDDNGSDAGAVYVYAPDGANGYVETKLTASDGAGLDDFGKFVSIGDNGQVLVGAPDGDGNAADSGALYVYTPDGNGGYTETKLTDTDGESNDGFGSAAAVNASGTIVVGSPSEDSTATLSGAIHVYTPDGNGGYTETRLVAIDQFNGDTFGASVDINSNGTIVVGATGNDDDGSSSGAVYVFVPDGNGGYMEYKLTAPDGAAGDGFGWSVSITEAGVVSVGAYKGDGVGADTGTVYTFVPNPDGDYVGFDDTVYTGVPTDGSASNPVNSDNLEPEKLEAPDGGNNDRFGEASVMNDNGVVLVGAHGDDDAGNASGAAYLYTPDGNGGYTELKLTASDTVETSGYGLSVALNNAGTAVVGAYNKILTGVVYVYKPDGNGGFHEAKLNASDAETSDRFGWSVDINEAGTIAVGAWGDDDNGSDAGAVYVYTPDGNGGYTETKLTASDGAGLDDFGKFVSIGDNGQVLVGAPDGDGNAADSGALYVYTPDGNGGYTETKLTDTDGESNDGFGSAAAVNASGTIVVGSPSEDSTATLSGAIHVYTPDGNGGYTETRLVAIDQFNGDTFGASVDINSNGTIVVGATGNDDDGSSSGAVYVFVPDGNGGYMEYKLTAPDGAAGDGFGWSVSITEAGVVSVGAYKGDGVGADTGTVYTFVPNPDGDYVGFDDTVYTGVPTDGSASNPVNSDNLAAVKLVSSDGDYNDRFAQTVAVNGSGVVLAAAHGDDDAGNASGAAFLYTPDGNGGYTELKMVASDTSATSGYGHSVALTDAGTAVIGAYNKAGTGAVYVYRPDSNGGFHEAKLNASDAEASDYFGWSVDVNVAGTVAVGAWGEDDAGSNAGAAYVYTPDGANGYIETKLTASDGGGNDNFGRHVSVGDTGQVVVGAYKGDGPAVDSGAVYLYTPDGQGGFAEAKLTASDGIAGDQFGISADVNGSGTVVVGSILGDKGTVLNTGAVYIYEPDGSGDFVETKLTALDGFSGDQFGYSVAINNSGAIVVGAWGNDDGGSKTGSAYVYVPDGNGGYTEYKLSAPDALAGDAFGIAVAINDDGMVSIGAQKGDGVNTDTGTLYTFLPDGNGNYAGPDGSSFAGVASDGLRISGSTNDNVLTGSAGDDTFVFAAGETGHDSITDFVAGAGSDDVVQFETSVFADFASVLSAAADDGTNTVITIDAGNSVELQNVLVADLHQDDFSFV